MKCPHCESTQNSYWKSIFSKVNTCLACNKHYVMKLNLKRSLVATLLALIVYVGLIYPLLGANELLRWLFMISVILASFAPRARES